jgi:uncharacterized protein (DUF362 family)
LANKTQNSDSVGRREFLTRCTKAGLSLAVGGALASRFYDPVGPSGRQEVDVLHGLPDYSVPEMGNRMAIVRGTDRAKTIRLAFEAIGGLENYVRPGDRVLLKVNAAFASPPMLCATSHPDLVAEVTRLCLKAGASSVMVADNPINDPASCFALSGIGKAAREAGAKVELPRKDAFRSFTLEGGQLIREWPLLYTPLQSVEKTIGMAPLKDHHRSGASMTLKNWYGLLGGRRNIFHQDIHNIIKELSMLVKATFVVLDGTTTMMQNGPTGGSLSDLRETGTMIVSTDPVAADAYGASLLERTLDELPFIRKAEAEGVGTSDYASLNPEILTTG